MLFRKGCLNLKLKSIKIEGFRKHYLTNVLCGDTTFLIGANNSGKSSILKAIRYLLEDISKMDIDDFHCFVNKYNENERSSEKVVITGEFSHLNKQATNWRGFNNHRLFKKDDFENEGYSIFYRKTFYDNGKCEIEMKQHVVTIKEKYKNCKTIQDFIDEGIDYNLFKDILPNEPLDKNLGKKQKELLKAEGLEEIYDYYNETEWFKNPGGISQNVTSKLPKFLLIDDKNQGDELSSSSGALISTLKQLFDDVRQESENFKQAQYYLDLLAEELNPNDEDSEFATLLKELNNVVGEVFPETSFNAQANLSNANDVITPKFDVQLGSNIHTHVDKQGAGVVRSAIFAMLRYKNIRDNKKVKKNDYIRPLLIAFEEPEIYLHPQAAKQMKETIYNLSIQANNQIICTTHSPYMIDLSKDTNQVLNTFNLAKLELEIEDDIINSEQVIINPFNVSEAYQSLIKEEKTYIKMLLKIDDTISKIFFAKNVLIIEGDTEEIVFKESIIRMPEKLKKEFSYNWEIVRARGKATIISLIKYLKSMGINPYVMHDRDANTPKAESFNEPIFNALKDKSHLFILEECIEDILGYTPPSIDKPYNAYKYIEDNWGDSWESVDKDWREIVEKIGYNN